MNDNKGFDENNKRRAKVRQAAALNYNPEDGGAPVVVAAGSGHIAEKMVELAEENKVPVVEDAGLASVLSKIGIGDEIPEELYMVVAQILIFIGSVDKDVGDRVKRKNR